MLLKLMESLKSQDTLEAEQAWQKLKARAAIEAEQQTVLQQIYFYKPSDRRPSLTMMMRAHSVDLGRCTQLLSDVDIDTWEFDTFALAKRLGKRTLSSLAMYIICSQNLPMVLGISAEHLHAYLKKVEDGYRDVPYHNCIHIADVLQRFHAIISKSDEFTPLERFAGYIAAVIHDYNHGGVTNSYLVATNNVLARMYNNRSPWENYHVFKGLEILERDERRVMKPESMRLLKEIVVDMVLATDMAVHVEVCRQLPLNASPEKQSAWLLKMFLKCADVGHAASPVESHKKWVSMLKDEMLQQAQLERSAGLPETWETMENSQLRFFDVIIIPLFKTLVQYVPSAEPLLAAAECNRALYL